MTAEGVEELIVAAAAAAFGYMVAFVPKALQSQTIEGWSPGTRSLIGWGAMLLGVLGIVMAFTSG